MNIQVLSSVAIVFVVVSIVLSLGLNIQSETQEEFVTDSAFCNSTHTNACGYEYNATQDGIEGNAKLSSYLPLMGLVVAAVVIISLIVGGFGKGKM